MTLQEPSPQLEESFHGRHFSRAMRELVARCLQKDPAKRPSAAQLLQHRFFGHAKGKEYVQAHLLQVRAWLPEGA